MLIRICLIVAILGGLGVAGIAFIPLKDQINSTISDRNKFHDQWRTELVDHKKAQDLADATKKEALDKTKVDLAGAKQERDDAKAAEANAVKTADRLQADLSKAKDDLGAAKDKLAAWEVLGIPLDQAKEILNSLKQVKAEKEARRGGKGHHLHQEPETPEQAGQHSYAGRDPEMPEGMSGKVLAVDPKFDFVVLNIGQKDGAVERGKLLVSRNGKLVAKVIITDSIQSNQCVANVMFPGYKQSDIMEGDEVFY